MSKQVAGVMRACGMAVALGLAGCGNGSGSFQLHWSIQDPSGNAEQCHSGDTVLVNIGDSNGTFACGNGGAGTASTADGGVAAYVGGAEMAGVFAGGPYNILVQLIDGSTGYIVTQTELDNVGSVPRGGELNAGVVTLITATSR